MVGFLSGIAIGNLIAFLFAHLSGSSQLFNDSFINRFGSETMAFIIHSLLSGVHGALSFSGIIFYELEGWGLAKATILHCLLINVSFLVTGLYLEWIPSDLTTIFLSIFIITTIFFIIWIIMAARYKREVRKLNELLEKEKSE